MANAARARRARQRRSAALKRLQAGHGLRRVFETVPDAYSTIPVHVILCACPGVGPVTMRKVLERSRVWPLDSLGDLTREQRYTILEVLPGNVT